MKYECIGLTGFAGDRTHHAMDECHVFTNALAKYLGVSVTLFGEPEPIADLPWDIALDRSKHTLTSAAHLIGQCIDRQAKPILVTPRCATAIATLPVIVSKFPNCVVIYFDAHGDLNIPATSPSGYLGGMPITAAMGEWDSGYGAGLQKNQLVHIGGRDLDESEKEFILQNEILTLSREQLETDLSSLTNFVRDRPVFIHIDVDVFDPSEVVAEYSVEDGLFREHIDSVLKVVCSVGELIGIEITELSPKSDHEREHSHSALFEAFGSLR